MADWRLAGSLVRLRDQVNGSYPNRSKISDGTIGDPAHAASVSDHNPNNAGVVTAFDITHDPANGVDIDKLSDILATSRDPRIKYLIANSQIMVPADYGWTWQQYSGENTHTSHLHVSVYGDYDNTNDWIIGDDMPVKVDLSVARILAYGVGGRNGIAGRPNALTGECDDDLNQNHVGQDLTVEYIQTWYNSPEGNVWRTDVSNPSSLPTINHKATFFDTMQKTAENLQKTLSSIKDTDPEKLKTAYDAAQKAFAEALK